MHFILQLYKLGTGGKKLLENLEGCISTTKELGLAKTRVAKDVSIKYTLTKLLVPKMHIFWERPSESGLRGQPWDAEIRKTSLR